MDDNINFEKKYIKNNNFTINKSYLNKVDMIVFYERAYTEKKNNFIIMRLQVLVCILLKSTNCKRKKKNQRTFNNRFTSF